MLDFTKSSRLSEDHWAQLTPGIISPKSMELHEGWAGTSDVFWIFRHPALQLCNSRLMILTEGFSEHSRGERKNMSSLGGFHHSTCTTSAIYQNSSHVSYPGFIPALKTPPYFTMLKNKFLHSWRNIFFEVQWQGTQFPLEQLNKRNDLIPGKPFAISAFLSANSLQLFICEAIIFSLCLSENFFLGDKK